MVRVALCMQHKRRVEIIFSLLSAQGLDMLLEKVVKVPEPLPEEVGIVESMDVARVWRPKGVGVGWGWEGVGWV